jgi:hypothetical protein
LPGGTTLALLLAERRGVRHEGQLPPYYVPQILDWADAHFRRTGRWPKSGSGPIDEAPGETWLAVDTALKRGVRGLAGGSSLPRLLAQHRGVRNDKAMPHLNLAQILAWADLHYQRTGAWPRKTSGVIPGTHGTTWIGVDLALRRGHRGLPGGSSLSRLLRERRPGSELRKKRGVSSSP